MTNKRLHSVKLTLGTITALRAKRDSEKPA
jgi:hypothetical protein